MQIQNTHDNSPTYPVDNWQGFVESEPLLSDIRQCLAEAFYQQGLDDDSATLMATYQMARLLCRLNEMSNNALSHKATAVAVTPESIMQRHTKACELLESQTADLMLQMQQFREVEKDVDG